MIRLSALPLLAALAIACTGAPAPTSTAAAQPTGTPATTPAITPAEPTPTATADDGTPPPDAGSGACRLLTTSELSTILEETVSVTESSDTSCTYSAAMVLPTINVRFESGESLESARMILTNPEDLTVGGSPAVFGEFMGHLLYVAKGGQTLVFQAIWGEQREPGRAKLVQIGEAAMARFPLP